LPLELTVLDAVPADALVELIVLRQLDLVLDETALDDVVRQIVVDFVVRLDEGMFDDIVIPVSRIENVVQEDRGTGETSVLQRRYV